MRRLHDIVARNDEAVMTTLAIVAAILEIHVRQQLVPTRMQSLERLQLHAARRRDIRRTEHGVAAIAHLPDQRGGWGQRRFETGDHGNSCAAMREAASRMQKPARGGFLRYLRLELAAPDGFEPPNA